jgi:hypothetical protein
MHHIYAQILNRRGLSKTRRIDYYLKFVMLIIKRTRQEAQKK